VYNLDLVYNPDLTPEDVSKLETARDEMKSVILKEPDLNNKQLLINEALKIQNQLDAHSAINNIIEHKEDIIDKINNDETIDEKEKEFYTKKITAIADHFDTSESNLRRKESLS
jgi:CCR4-NOT transcriptional regulation complex NOT5 subunit